MNNYVYEIGKALGYEPLSEGQTEESSRKILSIIDNMENTIKGNREAVELIVLCLIAGGHVMIKDLPGGLKTYITEKLYIVLDIQDPTEFPGTCQPPEESADCFAVRLSIDNPSFEDGIKIVMSGEKVKKTISEVITKEEIRELSEASNRVVCTKLVAAYIRRIVETTRIHPDIKLGSSPRGSIALFKLSCACALSKGRNYVLPDDIIYFAPFALGHRITLTDSAAAAGKKPDEIIKGIVKDIFVPIDSINGGT